jgi:hypothetical protein
MDFSIGGTVGSGVIRAGTILEGLSTGEAGAGDDALVVYGVLVDVYPKPDDGFHFGVAPGLAIVSSTNSGAAGWSMSPHVGYEWWVGPQWSLGVLGRVIYAEGTNAGTSQRAVAPSVLFSATYN